jgi:hypothetical protein
VIDCPPRARRAQIGYWRYISIYRHLQRNPDSQLYPLFEYFENWCQDENRHGDFFTAILKSQPQARPGADGRPARAASPAAWGVPCMRPRRPRRRRLALSAQAPPERAAPRPCACPVRCLLRQRAPTVRGRRPRAPAPARQRRRNAPRARARPGRRPA